MLRHKDALGEKKTDSNEALEKLGTYCKSSSNESL